MRTLTMHFRQFLVVNTTILLLSACATGPADPNERYVLTDAELFPSKIVVTDRRNPSDRARTPVERGYSIGDEAINPAPAAFLKSELARLIATEEQYSRAASYLNTREIVLTRFTVSLQRQDFTGQPSKQTAPGLAAAEFLIKSVTGSLFAHRNIAVEAEIEIEGQRYSSGPVTWTTNVVPYSSAAIFPASFAVRKLLQ